MSQPEHSNNSNSEDEPGVVDVDFVYYMFDWDDNILHMPTKIYLEKKTPGGWIPYDVSTAEFSLIRGDTENYRPVDENWDKAFEEFYDIGRRGEEAFFEDTMAALKPVIEKQEGGGPSFRRFRKALIEGRLFAIITARAHSSKSIRRGVEYFIEMILTVDEKLQMIENLRRYNLFFGERDSEMTNEEIVDKYLGLNRYRGVTSPEFQELVGKQIESGAESPAVAKQFAIREFVNHVKALVRGRDSEAPISIGFSDDDAHNVATVQTFIAQELSTEFPDIRFVVYDTSDPDVPRGRKTVITGQLELDLDHLPNDA
jgi:hypothetical protein